MTLPARPDPDALLARVRDEASRAGRGRLKIFLGASPGAGKTFAMLEAAQALHGADTDVVVGIVETHGRIETARLLEGLERLPLQHIDHRGIALTEFDLDGALRRHPAVLLVDELAHTNAPGSRHAKRWQDVEELTAAGIDVYTTLNVQHVESLNDIVAQVTGITVQETVPDAVVDEAAEIELVDVSPDVLLQRLREGKVYLPDVAERALERFFRRGNLIALRELALRRTAQHVDAEMLDWQANGMADPGWAGGERILVAVPDGPEASPLLRTGWRLARALHGDCFLVHVTAPGFERTTPHLAEASRLASELGVEVTTLSGHDAGAEILAWARREKITCIVVGAPHRGWHLPWRRPVVARLLGAADAPDVQIVSGVPRSARTSPVSRRVVEPARAGAYLAALAWVAAAACLGLLVRDRLSPADVAMLFLLAVAVASARSRPGPGVVAAIASIAIFDVVFVPPYYTFAVSDAGYLFTFVVMLGVAIAMSRLTSYLGEQAEMARSRERRTAALLRLAEELAATRSTEGVGRAVQRHLATSTGAVVMVLLPDEAGHLVPTGDTVAPDDKEMAVGRWAYDHATPAGVGTGTLQGAAARWIPMVAGGRAVGVIGLAAADGVERVEARQLVEAVAAQGAIALERLQLAHLSERGKVEIEAERLRTALLSSLSHDLRTPLAAVEGAVSTLLRDEATVPDDTRRDLLELIRSEGRRMEQLVRNLLDMVRMESGMLQVRHQWESLEDILGLVLIRLEEILRSFIIVTDVPQGLPLVRADALLLEQVLVNLLENAARHAPAGSEIRIGVRQAGRRLDLTVEDRGSGIAEGEEERIFEKFYRAPGAKGTGVGLGLAICRGIVTAHGGSIRAERREGGGLRIVVALPVPDRQPDPIPEAIA